MRKRHFSLVLGILGAVLLLIPMAMSRVSNPERSPRGLKALQSFIDSTNDTSTSKESTRTFAQFQLLNEARDPVRILRVESSCGCATPRVEPTTLLPGQTAIVYTEAKKPPFGERVVEFVVHTDSPASPKFKLHLRIASNRLPPYLSNVLGDLNFHGALKIGDRSEITVHTISTGMIGLEPKIKIDLNLFAVTLKSTKRAKLKDGLFWQQTYNYDITLNASPPPGIQTGKVIIEDPWDPGHTESIPVIINHTKGLRLFPQTLTLNLKSSKDYSSSATFVIKSDTGHAVSVSENEENQTSFLIFENSNRVSASRPGMSTMTVRLKPGFEASSGDYRFLVTSESGEKEDVSILVGAGEKP